MQSTRLVPLAIVGALLAAQAAAQANVCGDLQKANFGKALGEEYNAYLAAAKPAATDKNHARLAARYNDLKGSLAQVAQKPIPKTLTAEVCGNVGPRRAS